MSQKDKIVEISGCCPVCGTSMTIMTSRESLTLHKCTGCVYTIAMTDDLLVVLPSDFATKLMLQAEAVPCGRVVHSDLSTRYKSTKPVDGEYIDILSQFLGSDSTLDTKEVLGFLDLVDDSHSDWKNEG